MDQWNELFELISMIREKTNDDIVICTGYNENECLEQIRLLSWTNNIYFKFGRYKPNQENHFDEVLGVELASDNQYGKRIS